MKNTVNKQIRILAWLVEIRFSHRTIDNWFYARQKAQRYRPKLIVAILTQYIGLQLAKSNRDRQIKCATVINQRLQSLYYRPKLA